MGENEIENLSENLLTLFTNFNKNIFKHEEFMKSFPLPPSHVKVIFYLSHNGPSSISQLAKDLLISKSNMSPIVDRLIAENYIVRYEDPKDRRVYIIEATEKAKECFCKKRDIAKTIFAKKITSLSNEDIIRLNELAVEFNDIISKLQN